MECVEVGVWNWKQSHRPCCGGHQYPDPTAPHCKRNYHTGSCPSLRSRIAGILPENSTGASRNLRWEGPWVPNKASSFSLGKMHQPWQHGQMSALLSKEEILQGRCTHTYPVPVIPVLWIELSEKIYSKLGSANDFMEVSCKFPFEFNPTLPSGYLT